MTNHDPLCPKYADLMREYCECTLITEVRMEERERIANAIQKERKYVPATQFGDGENYAMHLAHGIALRGGYDFPPTVEMDWK
jgi:hypothetical protein